MVLPVLETTGQKRGIENHSLIRWFRQETFKRPWTVFLTWDWWIYDLINETKEDGERTLKKESKPVGEHKLGQVDNQSELIVYPNEEIDTLDGVLSPFWDKRYRQSWHFSDLDWRVWLIEGIFWDKRRI